MPVKRGSGSEEFKNGDLIVILVIGLFLAGIYVLMNRYPDKSIIQDRQSPLPSGMYTTGSVSNGMDVANRVNFQQQPYGGPSWG